jgi:hypothetical protein
MDFDFYNNYNFDDLSTPRRYFKLSNEGKEDNDKKFIRVNISDIREPTVLYVEKPEKEDLNKTEYPFNALIPRGDNKPLHEFAYVQLTHRFAPKKSKSKSVKKSKGKSKGKNMKKISPKIKKVVKSSDKRKPAGYKIVDPTDISYQKLEKMLNDKKKYKIDISLIDDELYKYIKTCTTLEDLKLLIKILFTSIKIHSTRLIKNLTLNANAAETKKILKEYQTIIDMSNYI